MAALAEGIHEYKTVDHPGIIDASVVCDLENIELQADKLIENRATVERSAVFDQEYLDNSRTAIMEALTASGHLSVVRLTGSLQEIEAQMQSRLLNGWDESLPRHERDRRYAEMCNLLYGREVRMQIVAGELPPTTALLEISDYPEPLAGTKIGYRHKNKKGMVRSSHLMKLGNDQYELVIEQVSRSNADGTSTKKLMEASGVTLKDGREPIDLAVLKKPVIYSTNDYSNGVVDIIRLLDEHQGKGVLYGDSSTGKTKHVSYENLRKESRRRETEIDIYCTGLAKWARQLDILVARGAMTREEQVENFNAEVDRILAAICTLRPDYAEGAYGENAAPAFYEAAILVAKGQVDQAEQLLRENEYLRDEVTFCGGTISTKQAEELGLGVNSYSKLIKKGKEDWPYKDGVCIVKSCESHPGRTKVGPCSVCKKCQILFNKGKDPTKWPAKTRIPRQRVDSASREVSEPKSKIRENIGRSATRHLIKRRRSDHSY